MRVCALLLLAGCAHAAAGPVARDEVVRALDDFHEAAARADEPRYFAHFAPDGVFLGTDATERWEVAAFRAYAHPHFARGKAWSFRAVRRQVAVRGNLAWFDEDLETPNLGPARGSGVLSLRDGKWLIEQYVLSITVPNERFRAVRELLAAP
jgi:SnoaL-like protein